VKRFILLAMVCIFCAILGVSAISVAAGTFINGLNRTAKDIDTTKAAINKAIVDNFPLKDPIIFIQGAINEVLGLQVVQAAGDTVEKNGDGYLAYVEKQSDFIDDTAAQLATFARELDKRDVTYVFAVVDYVQNIKSFADTTKTDKAAENMRLFCEAVQRYESTLDVEIISGNETEFYKTDHHWTVQTAFNNTLKFLTLLKSRGLKLEYDSAYENPQNWQYITRKDIFHGSIGRKVGKPWSGIDDFTWIYPKFNTDVTLNAHCISNSSIDVENKKGTFKDVLVKETLMHKEASYYDNSYFVYSYDEWLCKNALVNNDKKCLILGDSFGVPLTSFCTAFFGETRTVTPEGTKQYGGSLGYIDYYKPDAVILIFTARQLSGDYLKKELGELG
jgi:hypothetical protein